MSYSGVDVGDVEVRPRVLCSRVRLVGGLFGALALRFVVTTANKHDQERKLYVKPAAVRATTALWRAECVIAIVLMEELPWKVVVTVRMDLREDAVRLVSHLCITYLHNIIPCVVIRYSYPMTFIYCK